MMTNQDEETQEEIIPHSPITAENIRFSVISKGLFPWSPRTCCCICKTPLKYNTDHEGRLYFDSRCDCSFSFREGMGDKRDWEDLRVLIEIQRSNKARNEFIRAFGLDLDSPPGEHPVPPTQLPVNNWNDLFTLISMGYFKDPKVEYRLISYAWCAAQDIPAEGSENLLTSTHAQVFSSLAAWNIPFDQKEIMRVINNQ